MISYTPCADFSRRSCRPSGHLDWHACSQSVGQCSTSAQASAARCMCLWAQRSKYAVCKMRGVLAAATPAGVLPLLPAVTCCAAALRLSNASTGVYACVCHAECICTMIYAACPIMEQSLQQKITDIHTPKAEGIQRMTMHRCSLVSTGLSEPVIMQLNLPQHTCTIRTQSCMHCCLHFALIPSCSVKHAQDAQQTVCRAGGVLIHPPCDVQRRQYVGIMLSCPGSHHDVC